MVGFDVIDAARSVVKKDGTGLVQVFLEKDILLLAILYVEPGCSLKKDIHHEGEEGYYVIAGELTVTLPEYGVVRIIKPGEAFFVPKNTYHIVSNSGKVTATTVAAIGGKV